MALLPVLLDGPLACFDLRPFRPVGVLLLAVEDGFLLAADLAGRADDDESAADVAPPLAFELARPPLAFLTGEYSSSPSFSSSESSATTL